MRQLRKKVINALVCNPANDAERTVFMHLTRYIKFLSKDNILAFLRFIKVRDRAPDAIVVDFKEHSFRAPVAPTCINCLTLSSTYPCYNVLADEITNILKNKESFNFYFTQN